jgi:hypothetical protein
VITAESQRIARSESFEDASVKNDFSRHREKELKVDDGRQGGIGVNVWRPSHSQCRG